MHQNVIRVLVEELGAGGALGVTAQSQPRRRGLFITLRIDHPMQHGHPFGPHLRPGPVRPSH